MDQTRSSRVNKTAFFFRDILRIDEANNFPIHSEQLLASRKTNVNDWLLHWESIIRPVTSLRLDIVKDQWTVFFFCQPVHQLVSISKPWNLIKGIPEDDNCGKKKHERNPQNAQNIKLAQFLPPQTLSLAVSLFLQGWLKARWIFHNQPDPLLPPVNQLECWGKSYVNISKLSVEMPSFFYIIVRTIKF